MIIPTLIDTTTRCRLSGASGLCTGKEELRHQQEGLVPFVSTTIVIIVIIAIIVFIIIIIVIIDNDSSS